MKYEDEFNAALHAARSQFYGGRGVPARLLRQLYEEFAGMLIRIDREAGVGIITAERAEGLRRSILQEMSRFSVRFEEILIRSARDAAGIGAEAHAVALEAAASAAGVSVSHSFTTVPVRALENMMMRRGIDVPGGGLSGTFKTLVRRRLTNMVPEIDTLLTSAVARGQSAGRLTLELALAMSRDDPALALALERLGPRGATLLRKLQEGKLDELTDVPAVRSLLADSRRIAVSEILTAHDEATKLGMQESPVVDLVQWRTSGRHAGLRNSSPDVCDLAETANLHGYGPGIYNPKNVPSLLHPSCACTVTAILLRPAQWANPPDRPMPKPVLLTDDAAAKLLMQQKNEFSRNVTPKMVTNQVKMLNQKARSATIAARAPKEAA